MITITEAILSLIPNSSFSITNNDFSTIVWSSENKKPKPSIETINAEIERLKKEYEATQYQRDRAVAYDPIPEQLDQIYHDMDGWKAKIKAVKDKYPKP